jgi:bifunctional non-homologous end joining protein LigD
MRMAYELCLATAGKQVPSGPDWIHEVKHDGYRMLVIRENDRVRLPAEARLRQIFSFRARRTE